MANSDISIVFIGGEAFSEPEYFELCKKTATKNIHFLGWIDHNDPLLASAYMNAKVVILPSYSETFGLALIEGGVAGANLVASKKLPVIINWGIDKYCNLIDPLNINDIRLKITESFKSPKNPLLKKEIRRIFSWEETIEKYLQIYNGILTGEK